MSTNVSAYVNAAAVTRNATVLPLVQAEDAGADTDRVYAGAVRVGLNRLASTKRTYTNAQYVPTVDAGAASVTIAVENDDIVRADAIAAARSTTRAVVVGAAVNTGLAMLAGVDADIVGPFTT
jgi:hypothetical protein